MLQQSWEGGMLMGLHYKKELPHCCRKTLFLLKLLTRCCRRDWEDPTYPAAAVRFPTAVWVHMDTEVSSQSVRMQEWGAPSHLKRLSLSFFKNRKGEEKKIIVPKWLLGITSDRGQIAITDVLNAVSALLTNSAFVLLSTVSISDSLSHKLLWL